MLLQYAWKGFWRRRTHSLLVVLGIALSVGVLVAVVTITRSVEQAVAASLDAAGADMVIQKRVKACPFSVVKLPKDLAPIDESVVEKLRKHPAVKEASGVLELWAFHLEKEKPSKGLTAAKRQPATEESRQRAGLGDKGQGAVANNSQGFPVIGGKVLQPTVVAGIDPTKKTIGPVRVASREEVGEDESCCAVTWGRYLVPNDDYHVMVTEDYAQAKGIVGGQKIPLGLEEEFEVVALLDVSGAARIAGAEAFIPLKTAQDLLAKYSPSVGSNPSHARVVDTIFVSLAHKRDIGAVSKYAEELIGKNVSITTESNVDAGTAALASVTRNSLLAVSGFVLCFTLLILIRNGLENVARRVDEVGIMKAIGWRNADVARLFVAEAAYAGLFGGVLGSACGSLAGWIYGKVADLKLPETLVSWPACSTTTPPLALPLSTNPSLWVFLIGIACALLIGTVAGLVASHRAAQLDPVDALRRL